MNEESHLPHPDRDRPLAQAIAELGVRLRAGGPDGEIDEWGLYDESLRRLATWAEEEGCFFEGLLPLKEGGREHDLLHDPLSGSWLKFTKPAAAGFIVSFDFGAPSLEPALPLDYLERLVLQNELFADQVTFVGVAGDHRRPRIVTRQPDIPGEEASYEEIRHLMIVELGFEPLPPRFSIGYTDSLAFVRQDAAVFDLRPANVVRTEAGLIIPIDSIPTLLSPEQRKLLTLG